MRRFVLSFCAGLLLAASSGALAGPLPTKRDDDAPLGRALAAFVAAGAAAVGLAHGLKRLAARGWVVLPGGAAAGAAPRLARTQTLRLSAKTTLFLVCYDGRELLLAESDKGVELLRDSAGERP